MQVNISKESLIGALNKVGKAISGKSTNVSTHGIYFTTLENKILFKGTDMDISIETRAEAEIVVEGTVLVDYKIFYEIIKKLPNDTISLEKEDGQYLTIKCKKSSFKILLMDHNDFPNFTGFNSSDLIKVKVGQTDFKEIISKVIYAASVDDTRPILRGILFELKDGKLNLVALDGYRLSKASCNVSYNSQISVVLESKHLSDISKLMGQSGDILIAISSNNILFNFNGAVIMCRLLEGQYVNYSGLIDKDKVTFKVNLNRIDLLNCIERATLIGSKENTNLINIEIIKAKNLLCVNSRSAMGNSTRTVDIDLLEEVKSEEEKLDEFIISFNSRYLLDILKNSYSELMEFSFSTNIGPCLISSKEDESKELFLVLPVRTRK